MGCLVCIPLVVCAVFIVWKIYWKLTTKWNGSYICLVGKTAIVTGANTGIGYMTALDFAKRGARVILACRNKDRAEDAQRRIIKASGNENVVYKLLDLLSLESVRNFAEDFNNSEQRLDILVNNAGAVFLDNDHTSDNIQSVLQGNHVSPFLLTHLLIDKLKKSAPSRIINVSSLSAKGIKLDVESMNEARPVKRIKVMSTMETYGITKLCNILFTTELAKKLDGTGVTTNAVHPGPVHTSVFNPLPGVIKAMIEPVVSFLFLTSEEGAQTQIYVAVSNDVEGVTGELFANCSRIELYENARDPDLAKKVWVKSEELAKLSASEKISS